MATRSIDTREFLEKTPVFTTEQFRNALSPLSLPSSTGRRQDTQRA